MQYSKAAQKFSREDKLQMIAAAIAGKQTIEIVYLKAKDEKSTRMIRPLLMEEMEYSGHPFLGLSAFCLERREKRTFNVDRILEISKMD
jgi:predicted DNA-binding transcriptional regulator YafY